MRFSLPGVLVSVGAAAAPVMGLLVAPPDAVQGEVQRLMYVHVPAAWTAYLCFTAVLAAGLLRLVRRRPALDRLGRAAAEVGAGLTALAIVLGMLWGRPVWGVWWTWDPRLTTTVLMLGAYLVYLAVARLAGGRAAAWAGCAGFLTVPLVHGSVLWWRALHQPPTVLSPEGRWPIAPPMLAALLVSTAAFAALAAWVIARRARSLAAERPGSPVPAPRIGPEVPAGAAR
ncbi:cytochrome C biogenesis protein [Nonomuraea phyllanthi]|uniref:Heme exporter protein C n=1 Tax=Nonomuraea phyllanthi TaxID=2219224 RepID=A0A5C4WV65_9ACTN|nr:cytochrome c biogenesis protein CcsA [Nonomuraea phyllanthi]KAB8197421.1 cytochrome C biogenesis protein [Nonomuraea phyllanthi]QFY06586.1 cytochrome C biogenesis protein [Nonomuraea phyllanthi]